MISVAVAGSSRGNGSPLALFQSVPAQEPSLSIPSILPMKATTHQSRSHRLAKSVGFSTALGRLRATHTWEIHIAAAEASQLVEATSSATPDPEPQYQNEANVVVNPLKKPRLVLKFIWLEKNIGLALDQVIPGHGAMPLSPYYFWPRKDAWEELKAKLESKPWISQKRMIILLNQATDIINLWQQSGGSL